MSDQLYPTDLTDRQWEYIKPLIPAAQAGGRPRTTEMRRLINAILYIVVSGAQWRLLPREFPPWQTVYHYVRQWRRDGTWQRIHDTLRAAVRRRAGRHKHPTAGCLDSQSVKVAALPGPRGYDAGKQVVGRKRHVLVTWVLVELRIWLTVVSPAPDQRGFVVLARRWVVERTFAWLTQYRRLSKDYEATTASSEAMIMIAMIRLMVRRLARS
jgi:putative transposase